MTQIAAAEQSGYMRFAFQLAGSGLAALSEAGQTKRRVQHD